MTDRAGIALGVSEIISVLSLVVTMLVTIASILWRRAEAAEHRAVDSDRKAVIERIDRLDIAIGKIEAAMHARGSRQDERIERLADRVTRIETLLSDTRQGRADGEGGHA